MSAITDYTDKVVANLAAIATAVQALDQKIVDLQTQLLASGNLSTADATALQAVADQSAALAASAASIPGPPATSLATSPATSPVTSPATPNAKR
jgi:hypothetical protein